MVIYVQCMKFLIISYRTKDNHIGPKYYMYKNDRFACSYDICESLDVYIG